MKNRLLVLLSFFLLAINVHARNLVCNQERQNENGNQRDNVILPQVANKDVFSEAPIDSNEIIGIERYNAPENMDTFRWVSATQTLAYTVYFENDADLAMAATGKVSVTVPLHEKLNYAILGKVGALYYGHNYNKN